jgi:predicted small lipoprotein YifL
LVVGGSVEVVTRKGIAVASLDYRILSHGLVVGLLVAAVGLAGCGRKGALEAPPSATVEAAPADAAAPPAGAVPKPDKPFVLDGLLH